MDTQTREKIRRLLSEMEEQLCADMTLEDYARAFGYSSWHFARLFQSIVGMPLMRYRTRRRLAHALYAISQGEAIIDAALRYGFDTHAGFFKAFQREYGCSPSQYIKQNRVLAPGAPTLKEDNMPMISNAQWMHALSHWEIDLPLSPVIFPGSGRMHESCKKAGDTYFLKAFREYAPCRMQADLYTALHARRIPVGLPLPDSRGELIFESDGIYFLLCHALTGHPLNGRKMLSKQSKVSGESIGQALHRLHLALDDMEDCPIVNDENMLSTLRFWAIPCIRKMNIIEEEWLQQYEDKISALFPSLPMGPIHRDPNPGNMIKTANGNIGFLDFDLSERNIRLFDPCYAATAVLSECFEKKELWHPFFQSILTGYDAVSPLSSGEWAAAPLIALGIEMICIAAFADSEVLQDILHTNIRMLKWMKEQPGMQLK